VAQVLECLPSKSEALSSNPSTVIRKKYIFEGTAEGKEKGRLILEENGKVEMKLLSS
jgi:hypothetical protein